MGGLYNLLHGVNEDAPVLLAVLNIDSPVTQSPVGGPWRSGRFRDIYLNADGTRIILYTRNGGGNREHWANDTEEAVGGENCACPGCTITYHLPKHPNYIRDWDDEFDSTYAYVEFSVPEHAQEWMRRLATGRQPETVHQKFERVTAEMKSMTPEQIEADPRFSRLAKQLVRAASEVHSRQPDQPPRFGREDFNFFRRQEMTMIEQPDSEKPQEVSIPLGLTTPHGEPEPQWTGIARVLDHTGDTRIQWRKTDPDETAAAQARFDEYRRKSYVAYRLNEKGTQGEQMDAFDPSAERVILMPPMVGG